MPKELYLYDAIFSYSAEALIRDLDAVKNEEDVKMRVNSGGGSVFDGYGIITKMQEVLNGTAIQVDGIAASMAFFMLLFARKVTANDMCLFMTHRADAYVENEEDRKMLNTVNDMARRKLEERVPESLFMSVTGVSYAELFDPEKRIDVWLTAQEAKAIGLVDEIIELKTKKERSDVSNSIKNFTGSGCNFAKSLAAKLNIDNNRDQSKKIMNLETLKAEHPSVYNSVFQLGVEAGKAQETERVSAVMKYNSVNPDKVAEIVKSGNDLTASQREELLIEMTQKKMFAQMKKDTDDSIDEEQQEQKDEQGKEPDARKKELEEVQARMKKNLNIK